MVQTIIEPLGQLLNRSRLVARRLKISFKFKLAHLLIVARLLFDFRCGRLESLKKCITSTLLGSNPLIYYRLIIACAL